MSLTHRLHTEEAMFRGYDNAELFFQTWPVREPKAYILGVHGLGEHSGSYELLAEGLVKAGYQLFMSDLRGHGRSSGKRGVGTVDQFVRDVKVFASHVAPAFNGKPYFWLGHSMGGLVLLKLLIRHGDLGARGAVFSSPLLGVNLEIPAVKEKSAQVLAKLLPELTLFNEIDPKWLTHNKKVLERNEKDTLRHDRISSQLFVEMLRNIKYANERADKLTLPILMQLAGDDLVVSEPASASYFKGIKSHDKTKIIYEGYYHEIYNEIWNEKPIGDLGKWLDQRLSRT